MHYFAIHKPYGMLSQFTREADHHLVLGDLYDFPKTVYPVGRLDRDSEGLLILTDDKDLHTRLLHPHRQHERSYWVQVEGRPDEAAIRQLRQGVRIRAKKKAWTTLPARVELLTTPPPLSPRVPPIRERKNIPDSWLEITLTEGKNRQVRRMCAAVGFPVLRLVRHRIEELYLDPQAPEPVQVYAKDVIFRRLKLSEH